MIARLSAIAILKLRSYVLFLIIVKLYKKRAQNARVIMVGATWLEQATSQSRTARATNCATPRLTTILYLFFF